MNYRICNLALPRLGIVSQQPQLINKMENSKYFK